MPYKLDGSDAPDHVKKMPSRKRRMWVRVWNSAFRRCQSEGNKDCEARAFKQANAVVGRAIRSLRSGQE